MRPAQLVQLVLVTVLFLAMAGPVSAANLVQIRVGNHPTFTRVVFEFDAPTGYRFERRETAGTEALVVTLEAGSRARQISSRSAGVESVTVIEDRKRAVAEILLREPDRLVKEMILTNPPRVVLDFVDEEAVAKAAAAKKAAARAKAAKQAKPAPKPVAKTEPKAKAATPAPKPVAKPKPAPAPKPVARAKPPAPKPAPAVKPPKPEPKVVEAPKPKPVEPPKPAPKVVEPPKPEPKVVEAPKPKPVEPPKPAPKVVEAPTPKPAEPAATPVTPKPVAKAEKPDPAAKPEKPERKVARTMDPPDEPAPRSAEKARPQAAPRGSDAPRRVAETKPGGSDAPFDLVTVGSIAAGVLVALFALIYFVRRRSLPSDLDVTSLAADPQEPAPEEAAAGSIPSEGFSMGQVGQASGDVPSRGEEQRIPVAADVSPQPVEKEEEDDDSDSLFGEVEGDTAMMNQDVTTDLPADRSADTHAATMPTIANVGAMDVDVSALLKQLEQRVAQLESGLAEQVDARERLERQVAAQSEELRVQRAAIARTQRALRSLNRSQDDVATEPAPKA